MSGCIYYGTMYRTLAGGDSGDLVASACAQGVPHPPGIFVCEYVRQHERTPLHMLGIVFAVIVVFLAVILLFVKCSNSSCTYIRISSSHAARHILLARSTMG
jgi:hypothetical protein